MADGSVEVDITGNTSDFDKAVDGLTDKVSSGTIALGNVLADLAKKAISSLAGAVSDALDTGMTFEKSMSNVTALQQAAGATADDIALLKQAAEDYGASTQFTMAQCSDAAFKIVDILIIGIVELILMLLDCAVELIKQLCEFLIDDENRDTIIRCAESILQALIDGMEASMELVWTALGELWDELVEWFLDTDWQSLGEEILNGIASGMSTAVVAIGDTISDIGERIKDGFKSFFGIQSPSKLMRDEIGKFLLPGVTVGMEDTSAQAAYDMNKALDDAASRINAEALSMQINAAMQLHGASAAPTDFAQNIGISGNTGSTESLTDD